MINTNPVILKTPKWYRRLYILFILAYIIAIFIYSLKTENYALLLFIVYGIFSLYYGLTTIYIENDQLILQYGLFNFFSQKRIIPLKSITTVTPNFDSKKNIKSIRVDYVPDKGKKGFEVIKHKEIDVLYRYLETCK